VTIAAKICGVNSTQAAKAAVAGGAAFVGFVFFAPSPRNLTPDKAAKLARLIPDPVQNVGVFVDPSDRDLEEVLSIVPLKIIQLHGGQTATRIQEIRLNTGLNVMKAIQVAETSDLEKALEFQEVADWLLFDAKPPKTMASALPGGNALAFDWTLLKGRIFSRPWMLSGGLTPETVVQAAGAAGADTVDVSSGVEMTPGVKSPDKILAFLAATQQT
jgi:phosphoribosylanthranilate isomerase